MAAELVPTERAGAWVVRMDGFDQSYVDLDDPGHLTFDYVRRIGDVIDAWGAPGAAARVLHVGGAGLTLARYVAHTRPGSAQVVLEPDTALTDLVRRELPLPRRSGIKVRPVEGRQGLAGFPEGVADLVIVDAFDSGKVPHDLVTMECAADYARVLAPNGLVLLNLTDRAPFTWTRRAVAALRTALPTLMLSAEPATLRGRRPGNLLVTAGVHVPLPALRDRAATGAAPYRVLDDAKVSDTVGGGVPFTD